MERHRYTPDHPDYPRRLAKLDFPPALTTTGPLASSRAVAIVGSRSAAGDAVDFARGLARLLAERGITIISGGAKGIDTAAHRGALDAGGATWVVCPNGANHLTPRENEGLFEEVATSTNGRLVWPFDDDVKPETDRFLERNGVLVALSEAVVVVQAHLQSGSRNAANHALRIGRPLYMPAAPPWGMWKRKFGGCLETLENRQAILLTSENQLLLALGLEPVPEPIRRREKDPSTLLLNGVLESPPDPAWSPDERAVFTALSLTPRHRDEVASKAALPIGQAATALLTLTIKDVVVEGPEGSFRRRVGG